MNRKAFVILPRFAEAVETVAERAKKEDNYPDLFTGPQIVDALNQVIVASGYPLETPKQRQIAERLSLFHLGLFLRDHGLIQKSTAYTKSQRS